MVVVVRSLPVDLLAGVEKSRKAAHGVPAESARSLQAGGLLHPFADNIFVAKNPRWVIVNEPDYSLIGGKLREAFQPAFDFHVRITMFNHFLESGRPVHMHNGKRPDVLAFAHAIAITLCRSHPGFASEVIADKAVGLQPSGDPRRLITVWRGVLDIRLAGDALQR